MDWIEIFRTGSHTDSAGNTREWTEKDLQEIASLYNPQVHEAPIVIGHPETDSPAYGWVEKLKVEAGKLLALPGQVADVFRDWFAQGHYKKISIALYPDMSLRHVGFLGATPPAVKGLKQTAFGDKKAAWVIESEEKAIISEHLETKGKEIKIGADAPEKGGNRMKEFFEKLVAFVTGAQKEFAEGGPVPSSGAKFTEAEVQAREAKAKKEVEIIAFAEAQKQVEVEVKAKEEAQKKSKEIETQKRKEGIAAFCEAQCKEGKLTPALRKIIEPIMNFVSDPTLAKGGEGGFVIEFSEGVKKSPLEGIKDFLTELPKVVTFTEVVKPDGPNAGGSAGEKLSALTKTKMEVRKDLTYSMAFAEVQKENPDLTKEYQAEFKVGTK